MADGLIDVGVRVLRRIGCASPEISMGIRRQEGAKERWQERGKNGDKTIPVPARSRSNGGRLARPTRAANWPIDRPCDISKETCAHHGRFLADRLAAEKAACSSSYGMTLLYLVQRFLSSHHINTT